MYKYTNKYLNYRSLNRTDADEVTTRKWSLIPMGMQGAQWTIQGLLLYMLRHYFQYFISTMGDPCYSSNGENIRGSARGR